MKSIIDRISAGDALVCDGATGTLLFEMGLQHGESPESLALSHPDLLETLAKQYLAAGADIIEACTFGASPLKLSKHGLEELADQINREAVGAVRTAVGDKAYVGASVGPTGKILQPYGDVSETRVYDSYRQQMEALVAAGIDCVLVETMLDINEASLAIRAAKDVSPSIPVTATMTFEATPRGFYTIMGVDVAAAVTGLVEAGADVIGSNCGNGIDTMVEIARAFRNTTDHPLIIQSNAGLPEIEDAKVVYRESPAFMAERVEELLEIGVSIVGGCCGTTPEHIRAFRALVDRAAQ